MEPFIILLAVVAMLWVPWICFTIYLAREKGYNGDGWVALALLFTIPTFLTVLGLPDRNPGRHIASGD